MVMVVLSKVDLDEAYSQTTTSFLISLLRLDHQAMDSLRFFLDQSLASLDRMTRLVIIANTRVESVVVDLLAFLHRMLRPRTTHRNRHMPQRIPTKFLSALRP